MKCATIWSRAPAPLCEDITTMKSLMMSAKNSLYSLIAFFVALVVMTASLCAQTRVPHHPLDALTTDEYWTVHDVLEQSGHLTGKTLFSSVLLHEPDKEKVLAWKQGDPIPREADVILEDQGKTIEARVDIAAHKLEFWNRGSWRAGPYYRVRTGHHE